MSVPAPLIKLLEKTGSNSHMRVARFVNGLKYQKHHNFRQQLYQKKLAGTPSRIRMQNAWAKDTTQSLPYLKELLADSDSILAENRTAQSSKQFMVNLLKPDDLAKYPSLLNFASSPELIKTAAEYLGEIPVFSSVKLLESSPGEGQDPKSSQLFHLDIDIRPQVKVIVNLINIDKENGPFTFIPSDISNKITQSIQYGSSATEVRVPDETVFEVASQEDIVEATGKKGDVLFVDTGNCLHFGSRNITTTRYLLMFQFTPVIRTDFRQVISYDHFISADDDWIRQAVLNRKYTA